MRRSWGLTIFTLLMALAFVSGCTKKTVLKEDVMATEKTASKVDTPAVKAPEKSKAKEDAKKRAEQERLSRETALRAQAKKEAAAKEAAKQSAALSSNELYELADIHFDFDKFNLSDEARAVLNKHAAWLNKNKAVKITIEGHCDERGTAEYNLALGERRAVAVAKYFTDMGVDDKRIKTISYGFELPLDPRHNDEAWAKNRRAHIGVSSK